MTAPDSRLDRALRSMGELPAPPPSAALESLVAGARPVARRRPGRTLAVVLLVSLVVGAAYLLVVGTRHDRTDLPAWWFWGMAAAWLVAYIVPLAIALVPRRGSMLVETRSARVVAIVVPALAVAMAVVLRVDAPSTVVPTDPSAALARLVACLSTGLATSAVAFAIGVTALRRAPQPLHTVWIGAALGAASGTLAGLVLHVHCWVGGALHAGVGHAGEAVIGAIAGALLVPRLTARGPASPPA